MIGDIGPFGGLMEPYGDIAQDAVRDAFREQAAALVDAGADAIMVETQDLAGGDRPRPSPPPGRRARRA